MKIGIEAGGTFTDVVALDESGDAIINTKVFSTPHDPSEAVSNGLSLIGSELLANASLLHGSTVATNALIERKGARVGLITTKGFKDVVYLRRQSRSRMYDLRYVPPSPFVEPNAIVEVKERIDAGGNVIETLDLAGLKDSVHRMLDKGIESIAVALLHSYVNPTHENLVKEHVAECFPGIRIAISSESAREFREYERTTTVTADAFLRPVVSGYLERLAERAQALGLKDVRIMQSNGGTVPLATAANLPLTMLRSGPAAGVSGAIAFAQNVGIHDIITMDMGGTSVDIAVITSGIPETTQDIEVDRLTVRTSTIDILAAGAGGGSIIGYDSGGLLTIGPESAGGDPGPACYGRGGLRPTVTDANVVRGLIQPGAFLGGRRTLDVDAARRAMSGIAEHLGRSVEELAEDIYNLANSQIAGAIRLATIERGYEASEYTLVSYGGAGPLHAAAAAGEVGIKRVLIPPFAGLVSAYGLLASGFKRMFGITNLIELPNNEEELKRLVDQLYSEAKEQLRSEDSDREGLVYTFTADMRYRGQGFEISVPVGTRADLNEAKLVQAFHDAHLRRYGHSDETGIVQLVTLRLMVSEALEALKLPKVQHEEKGREVRASILEGYKDVEALFIHRQHLKQNQAYQGPVIVQDDNSTSYVPTGWTMHVDAETNLILERA
ncbi:MAG: hydantoinase/oxoprolinase family protein [Steroidobacteraceae bacterium]